MKTETCKLYSRDFEYFCQIPSKSILTISRYTFQSWVVFLRHSVVVFIFVIISQVIGWDGWVFCSSQEVGWVDCRWNILSCVQCIHCRKLFLRLLLQQIGIWFLDVNLLVMNISFRVSSAAVMWWLLSLIAVEVVTVPCFRQRLSPFCLWNFYVKLFQCMLKCVEKLSWNHRVWCSGVI